MYPWGRATLRTPQRRVWELISNHDVCFHFNLQVIRQGKVNVSLGQGYIDFKTKFWKNINVTHSGSFHSYDFLCVHLWMVFHPSFVPARRIQFGSRGFGLTPWLCSRGSKRWKRMRRRRQKDRLRRSFALHTRSSWRRCQVILLWWRTFQCDELYYVQINFSIKDVFLHGLVEPFQVEN